MKTRRVVLQGRRREHVGRREKVDMQVLLSVLDKPSDFVVQE